LNSNNIRKIDYNMQTNLAVYITSGRSMAGKTRYIIQHKVDFKAKYITVLGWILGKVAGKGGLPCMI
jgi:hypothetical protein